MWWDALYNVLDTINSIILILIGIPFFLQLIYMFLFFIPKKTFPKTEKKNKICILIPAHNEEDVIYETIKEIYNNQNVNLINEVIEGLADGERLIYLDVNELFDDEEGYLNEEYTSDAFHVLGRYYEDWVDWLCTKAIIQEVNYLESGY